MFQEVGQLKRQTSKKHSHDSLDIGAIKNADVISFGWYLPGLIRIVSILLEMISKSSMCNKSSANRKHDVIRQFSLSLFG